MALGPSMHCGCCGQALVTAMWCSLRRRGVRDSSSALDATPPLEQTRSAAAVSTLAPTERTNAVAKTTSHSVTHPMWPGVGCSGVGCCASQRKLATDGNRGSYLLEHGAASGLYHALFPASTSWIKSWFSHVLAERQDATAMPDASQLAGPTAATKG